MPYLQLDIPNAYPSSDKKRLATRLGRIYADLMQANVRRITVAIRELNDGCGGAPRTSLILRLC